ncbi:unnamed protein product [Dimorphilus gyrociliatus]|uniref:C2H2-type domain-containing protein n=1 Tax=Dimorphilus gyrociliatus TaxID=2664684 RepID=A0A7I8VJI7_9ANNE|nr:unnamed protein product [Dimorphilus gyrociliatus]
MEKEDFLYDVSAKLSPKSIECLCSTTTPEVAIVVIKEQTGMNIEVIDDEWIANGTLNQIILLHSLLKQMSTEMIDVKPKEEAVPLANVTVEELPLTQKSMHSCDRCPYSTKRKEHLKRHMQTVHFGVRKFLCPECGKKFKRNDALQDHLATHDQETKKFFCCHCEQRFRRKHHLDDHMRGRHSNKRQYLCEECGVTFKTRGTQRRHQITVHNSESIFKCTICNKGLSSKYALARHVKVHEDDGKGLDHSQDLLLTVDSHTEFIT